MEYNIGDYVYILHSMLGQDRDQREFGRMIGGTITGIDYDEDGNADYHRYWIDDNNDWPLFGYQMVLDKAINPVDEDNGYKTQENGALAPFKFI